MKKVIAGAAAFLVAVAPCSLFFASIEPVRASAADILTPEETLALFGSSIRGVGYLGNSINPSIVYFDYITDGWVSGVSNGSAFVYSPLDNDCIVYRSRSPYSFNNSLSSSYTDTLTLYPDINLSNVTDLSFTIGLTFDGVTLYNPNSSNFSYTRIKYLTNFWTQPDDDTKYQSLAYTSRNGIKTVASESIKANETDWSLLSFNIDILPYVFDLHSDTPFTFNVHSDSDCGLFNHNMLGKNSATNTNGQNPDVNTYTFLVIECPTINSDYVNNNSGGSSDDPGGGSGDCNCSHIDYTSKLDTLINQGVTFNEQLNDIYMENQHQNSKLDSSNQKLDQVNSNLNKIDSHIQQLQIPDLTSQSSGDMSHIAQNESKNNSDLRAADANQQTINSVAGYGDVSLPSLDNVHSMPDDFSELWNYTDQDGLSWINPLLYAMPILTLTVGALAYIVFGRAR